ncbi:response regulator [Sinorhizobium medicae]|uniref:response regulator n=2 Tax=Sinorhizobium medicae TaxID=110321 RepID=UPI0027DDA122|nr:response regulator [Sinorhizobium medicae]
MRVLLVEDDEMLGDAVKTHVHRQGHAVDWALTRDEAEASLEAAPYDLVLLDLRLPDGSGLDILKALRAHRDGFKPAERDCQEFCAVGHDDEKERIITWLSRKNFWTSSWLDVIHPRFSARTVCWTI